MKVTSNERVGEAWIENVEHKSVLYKNHQSDKGS